MLSLPNQLTVLRIVLTPIFIITFILENLTLNYLSFFIFFIASLTDHYDGILARRHGTTTHLGRFLDPLADKILVSSAFIVFACSGIVEIWMVILIIIRDLLVTLLRSYAMYKGKPIVTSYLAKAKTTAQIIVIYFIFAVVLAEKTLIVYDQKLPIIDKIISWNVVYIIMLIVTLLTVFSGLKYLFENRDHLKSMALDFFHVFNLTNL